MFLLERRCILLLVSLLTLDRAMKPVNTVTYRISGIYPESNSQPYLPSVDAQSLSPFTSDDLLNRVITLSRLNLEEHQVPPLDVLLGRPLDSRRSDFLRLSIRNGVQLKGTAPFWVPPF